MRVILLICLFATATLAQMPKIEPGVSQELAKWRAVQYSNISYKLNLTLEKMSPVLKGTIEIHVQQAAYACAEPNCPPLWIVLDWRKLAGHEKDSTISNLTLNGAAATLISGPPTISTIDTERMPPSRFSNLLVIAPTVVREPPQRVDHTPEPSPTPLPSVNAYEFDDHLIFNDGVRMGENVIKLDFTSPILTSGSAITRYIDKEDGAEYIYSLFVPSDASTAFPCFDQPDLKAKFTLTVHVPRDADPEKEWTVVSNAKIRERSGGITEDFDPVTHAPINVKYDAGFAFEETQPISTYVFGFATGPFLVTIPAGGFSAVATVHSSSHIYVRRSQGEKFRTHAAEVERLRDEGIKYLEIYFDYKFPFPKLDIVLIPEFPFGGMEHAGAIFLREDRVIFPAEPTKGDYITRANLIFHETAHQWFGDTVTMRWFDDLWLKEGFAEFMAYKTLEKVMPDANAWKVFYERNKQAAYATDSTRGTTPIYQPIANLSAAKSAYGNIVYRKAPSFLRQAEFYLGEDKFQTAVRAFLKKHEFGNAGWEDLVKEFEIASGQDLKEWANAWVTRRGVPEITIHRNFEKGPDLVLIGQEGLIESTLRPLVFSLYATYDDKTTDLVKVDLNGKDKGKLISLKKSGEVSRSRLVSVFPNYQDYGYGIFLLDDKSRDYVLKNIQNEKDPFLRSMMWGALWDSVREAELDPKDYVELAIKNLPTEADETIVSSILSRVSTAINYYIDDPGRNASVNERARGTETTQRPPANVTDHVSGSGGTLVHTRVSARLEAVLLDRLQHAQTPGERITFYHTYVANAATTKGREVLKQMLTQAGSLRSDVPPLRTKDRFDIVTRLAILGDPDAPKLLAELEKTETSDDAKRYAYAAHAAFGTADNKAKFWNDFVTNKDLSESWIESAIGPFNSIKHADLTQQYLERSLKELPNLKRTRKIFFINNWLAAWIGGQRDQKALDIVNKFLADNPTLDNDLRLKVLENVDLIEHAVKIRNKYP